MGYLQYQKAKKRGAQIETLKGKYNWDWKKSRSLFEKNY